ncbi:MAG TPA: tetratricopeptide repeat protein, partial [Pyrinomonadaceae bacterium]|nr:tetratricopeptide repeat protein [Pyrinomonadaceae bacterium]
MSYYDTTHVVRARISTFLLFVGLVLALPMSSLGQGGVGSTRGLPDSAGGIHTIKGIIYLPTGKRAGAGILLRLASNVAGSRTGATDTDGSFMFNGLPAGEYRITIDAGSEYVPLNQSVVIYGTTGGAAGVGRVGQTLMIDLHLISKEAAALGEKMFAGVPKEAVDSYRKALQSAHAGNSKKAIELLDQAISKHPKFGVALMELGTQYLKLGEPKKAAESLKQAAELMPADFTTRLNYGIALINEKKFIEAEKEFREALKINAASPVA